MKPKIVILPCSGIGKPYGEIARQAVYKLADEDKPGEVATTCLGLVMIRDAEAMELLDQGYIITVDGCAKDCARKNVEASGHKVDSAVRTIEVFKEHKDLKPDGVLNLGEAGTKLADFLAVRLGDKVECAVKEAVNND